MKLLELLAGNRSGKFHRSYRREAICGAIVAALVLARWLSSGGPSQQNSTELPGGLKPGIYEIERVVDGDTLVLEGVAGRVRLQGIDTPETVKENTPVQPWGPEATAFTRAFIAEAGRRVRVEIDGAPRDGYGRYLVFLWNGEQMLNEELVRAGLARARLQYDYSSAKKARMRRAQRDAQKANRGIWSSRPPHGE